MDNTAQVLSGHLLYIPGISTFYPSANIIETQHMVGKGNTNTKEPLMGHFAHTER